ncbi:hypothetical protein, partial [Limnohabitans sp. DM1]|uniref:hypothetical protein n=1 Tax=Limnohabitans sp. DM1 TaxID=1597955 RepID=UPI0018928C2B
MQFPKGQGHSQWHPRNRTSHRRRPKPPRSQRHHRARLQHPSSADLVNTSSGTLKTATGIQSQSGKVTISANTLRNQGLLAAAQDLDIQAWSIDNQQGTLAAVQGNLQLSTSQGGLDNRDGRIQLAKDLTLTLQGNGNSLRNTGGKIQSISGQAHISSGALDNSAGLISTGGALNIDTHGQTLTNQDSHSNDGTRPLGLIATGDLRIQAADINNRSGLIQTQGTLNVQANDVGNNAPNALIFSAKDSTLTLRNLDNNGGKILAVGALTLQASDTVTNTKGLLRAGSELGVTSSRIQNTQNRRIKPTICDHATD